MAATGEKEARFCFQPVPAKKFLTFESSEVKDLLMKWGMKDRTTVQMFTYDNYFQIYEKDKFVKDFFQDPNIISTLQNCRRQGFHYLLRNRLENPSYFTMIAGTYVKHSQHFRPLPATIKTPEKGVTPSKTHAEPVPCTIISMDFFDRLYSKGIVRECGNIKKCFDEFYEDFAISDELRKVLLLEEAETYPMFSDDERKELLFLIFKHICLGGQVCQYEDTVQPYLETAKDIYKDIVSVHKDPKTKELRIGSIILKISAMDEDDSMLYPSSEPHDQSFAYMCIDVAKRHVNVWYHSWQS